MTVIAPFIRDAPKYKKSKSSSGKDECFRCGHRRDKHNYDFTTECSDCSGGQCPKFVEVSSSSGNSEDHVKRVHNKESTENPDIIIEDYCNENNINYYQVIEGIELYDILKDIKEIAQLQTADERDQFWQAKIEEILKDVRKYLAETTEGNYAIQSGIWFAQLEEKYLGGKHE